MKGHLTMSQKERKYLSWIHQVEQDQITVQAAAERCQVTERHMYRLLKRYHTDSDSGLIHRLRGKSSNRGYGEAVVQRVRELYRKDYSDYGTKLFSEILEEDHQMRIDHETLRRWLTGLCRIQRKGRLHRKKRPRRRALGELVQFDGSLHDWFEGRVPKCCLLVTIDDATGTAFMRFCDTENEWVEMRFLRDYCIRFGRPASIYVDRASTIYSDGKPTSIAQALERLNIQIIFANSPQAKGRVERHNRTLQDRLVKALRRLKINSIDQANAYLEKTFIDEYNGCFASLEGCKNIHRNLNGYDPDFIFSFPYDRQVRFDYTLLFRGQYLQLLTGKAPLPRPKQLATIRQYLDRSLHVFYNDQELACRLFIEKTTPISSSKIRNRPARPQPSDLSSAAMAPPLAFAGEIR